MKPTVCLAMMVKNESAVVRRALESAKPWIDSWIVCDTGSTDGTQAIVLDVLGSLPGDLIEVPWVNFGANRTQLVRLARAKTDYVLIMDADMVLNVRAPFKEKLTADAYELRYEGSLDYTQTMLVSSRHEWNYVGVTHEYITSPTALRFEQIHDISLTHLADGAMRTDKFERDICLLTKAVIEDPTNPRSLFYLAQSYKDFGHYGPAEYWYGRRVLLEGFDEERWYAMYQKGRMAMRLGEDWEATVLPLFLKAYQYRPTRIEPIYEIVQHYRAIDEPRMAFFYASVWGHDFPYPKEDRLFIDATIYQHLMPYEFAFAAIQTGRIGLADRTLAAIERNSRDTGWMQPWIAVLKTKIQVA
jgi:glycosyltransferase involved in cell wall biosynthesis